MYYISMSWQAFILVSVLFLSVGTLFQRIAMKEKESDPWSFSVIFQILVASLIYLWTLFTSETINLSVPIYHPNIVLMTGLWALANILIYNAFKTIQASTFSILFATRSLFTLITSTIFLGESVEIYQVFGIALILLGVAIVSVQRKGFSMGRSGVLAIAAAACVGFANTNDRMVLKLLDVPTYSVISYLFPGIFLLMLKPTAVKKISKTPHSWVKQFSWHFFGLASA